MLEQENIELKKISNRLKKENSELKKQIQVTENEIGSMRISGFIEKKQNAPAYRDDIDINKIVLLCNKGKSMNKIAEAVGCSAHTVRSRLMEYGIRKK